ncbi:FAD:protein FMN transferase ApbE [Moritella marina ATCC 15381]|uniref:FAD:protein FMN transferase n=2 Tax=Moritella marina TaxID=90736 RepID=A0A5J6WQ54_MORMI|nr:FAD:protein FMN transferase ApbE [Moritella marina ATCC 15381]
MYRWLALMGLAIFILGCSEQKSTEEVLFSGPTMGTTYHMKVVGFPLSEQDKQDIQIEIDRRLELVNDQMSTYRPNSELSRFNQSVAVTGFEVSTDTAKVVLEALRLNKLTNGALDVTVGPLVNLWGFGPDNKPEKVPSQEQLDTIKLRIGIQHLAATKTTLSKDIDGLYVDLSSIAKGYGVDVIADYFASLGIENYLVEVGGELRINGVNARGIDWQVAVEKPTSDNQSVQEVIAVGNNAIATSGDYRNYYELNGERFAHTIDPVSGKPIKHKLVSVTVIHTSSMTADALATALMVMGEKDGLEFAKQQGLAVLMISKSDSGYNEVYTKQFEPYLK